jgi:hypothetical protein
VHGKKNSVLYKTAGSVCSLQLKENRVPTVTDSFAPSSVDPAMLSRGHRRGKPRPRRASNQPNRCPCNDKLAAPSPSRHRFVVVVHLPRARCLHRRLCSGTRKVLKGMARAQPTPFSFGVVVCSLNVVPFALCVDDFIIRFIRGGMGSSRRRRHSHTVGYAGK